MIFNRDLTKYKFDCLLPAAGQCIQENVPNYQLRETTCNHKARSEAHTHYRQHQLCPCEFLHMLFLILGPTIFKSSRL